MKEARKVTRFTRTVYSTTEYEDLQRRATDAGARIIDTKPLPQGMSVVLESDRQNKQY